MLHLEAEVKNLHAAVDQIQVTLASPDLNRLSLREQLTQRQVNTHFRSAWLHSDHHVNVIQVLAVQKGGTI